MHNGGEQEGHDMRVGSLPCVPKSSECGVFTSEMRLERECGGGVDVFESQAGELGLSIWVMVEGCPETVWGRGCDMIPWCAVVH